MDIKALVSRMTLEEKAGLLSGDDFWHTKAVERLGVPRAMVSDGPHGLRKQDETDKQLQKFETILLSSLETKRRCLLTRKHF